MSQERPTADHSETNSNADNSGFENTSDLYNNATIRKKDCINPDKRRRLEAMREERELLKDIKDVFDDVDD